MGYHDAKYTEFEQEELGLASITEVGLGWKEYF